ncbi:MAG: hypothetical protein V4661_15850 [Pseudomonadota bacterium]
MAEILPFPQHRSLAQVLAELMLADAELKRLDGTIGDGGATPAQDARWAHLEDTIWLRRDEAKAMIETATGVSWSNIEGANL